MGGGEKKENTCEWGKVRVLVVTAVPPQCEPQVKLKAALGLLWQPVLNGRHFLPQNNASSSRTPVTKSEKRAQGPGTGLRVAQ